MRFRAKILLGLCIWNSSLNVKLKFQINRLNTPYEILCNKKLVLAHIEIWGCPAYVKHIKSDTLGAKSDKCLFMEYPKGYNLYHSSEQNCPRLELCSVASLPVSLDTSQSASRPHCNLSNILTVLCSRL